jgi:plasmid stabilization system protein ParE
MNEYVLAKPAEEDLYSIWSYIASDRVEAADRVESAIYSACRFLANHPQAGHVRSDLTSHQVRFWALPRYTNYLIVYDPNPTPLRVLRILHGALDAEREVND